MVSWSLSDANSITTLPGTCSTCWCRQVPAAQVPLPLATSLPNREHFAHFSISRFGNSDHSIVCLIWYGDGRIPECASGELNIAPPPLPRIESYHAKPALNISIFLRPTEADSSLSHCQGARDKACGSSQSVH